MENEKLVHYQNSDPSAQVWFICNPEPQETTKVTKLAFPGKLVAKQVIQDDESQKLEQKKSI